VWYQFDLTPSNGLSHFYLAIDALYDKQEGVSPITKRNYVVESIGIVFLIYQKDVDNPW
jgi:hypothetical protein